MATSKLFAIIALTTSAGCVTELDEPELGPALADEGVIEASDDERPDLTTIAAGTSIPGDVTCDGSLCLDQEWHACGGYNYRGRVYLSRSSSGVLRPYYTSVWQYSGDRFRHVNGLDWQIWLKNDNGLLGATTYHNDDPDDIGTMNISNFDPPRASHPYVEILAGKSQDGEASCRFRIYLYSAG
jgi:hypothetical protein